jgi:hypothetical protein
LEQKLPPSTSATTFLARAGKFKFCNRNFSPLVLVTFIQNSALLVVFSALSFALLFVASKKSINEAARIRCNDTGESRKSRALLNQNLDALQRWGRTELAK